MASMLCGCSKKSRHDRSSMYVVSGGDQSPPTMMSDVVAPAGDDTVVLGSVRRAGRHVDRYWAGDSAVTVSVRPHPRHHHHHDHHQRHDDDTVKHCNNDITTQLSNYDSLLDDYLHAAIATEERNISSQSGKVQTTDL